MPPGLDPRSSMILGTAGFTAALCVDKLEAAGMQSEGGPVLVTGATGGVGSVAVKLLARLGYEVHAVTGKGRAARLPARPGRAGGALARGGREGGGAAAPEARVGRRRRHRRRSHPLQRRQGAALRGERRRVRPGRLAGDSGHGLSVHPAPRQPAWDRLGGAAAGAEGGHLGAPGRAVAPRRPGGARGAADPRHAVGRHRPDPGRRHGRARAGGSRTDDDHPAGWGDADSRGRATRGGGGHGDCPPGWRRRCAGVRRSGPARSRRCRAVYDRPMWIRSATASRPLFARARWLPVRAGRRRGRRPGGLPRRRPRDDEPRSRPSAPR